jgi:ankyrin repeat protein
MINDSTTIVDHQFDEFEYGSMKERVEYILAGGVRRLNEYFVDKVTVESECTCQICQELFENPVFLPNCLHTFCRACLVQWEANQKPIDAHKPLTPGTRRRVPRATCPLCREKFLIELSDQRRSDPSCLVRPNPVMRRVIYSLRIHCPLGACRWLAPLADLVPHVVHHCPFFTTACPRCHASLFRAQLPLHRCPDSAPPLIGAADPDSWGMRTMHRVLDAADDLAAPPHQHVPDDSSDSIERDERDAIARELSAAAAALGPPNARRASSARQHPTRASVRRDLTSSVTDRSSSPSAASRSPIVLEHSPHHSPSKQRRSSSTDGAPPPPAATAVSPPPASVVPAAASPAIAPARQVCRVTLSRLRAAVDECGGFVHVEQSDGWPKVAKSLDLPRNSGTQLRAAYLKKLPSSVKRLLNSGGASVAAPSPVPASALVPRGSTSSSSTEQSSAVDVVADNAATSATPSTPGDVELSSSSSSVPRPPHSPLDANGRTPLCVAAHDGDIRAVAQLLSAKFNKAYAVDRDHPDAQGWTPLLVAASERHTNIVALLLAAGAKADSVTPSGDSALHFLAAVVPDGAQRSAYRRVLADLVAGGASVVASRGSGGMTPLHIAAREGNAVAAYVLLTSSNVDADAIASTAPVFVPSALGSAASLTQIDLFALLRSEAQAAELPAAPAAPAPAWTALHWAAALGDVDLCELMLMHGVTQVAAEDEHGTWQTPEEIAKARGHETVVALLRRHSERDSSGQASLLNRGSKRLVRTQRFAKLK